MTATPTPILRVSMGATSCHESLSGSYLHGTHTQTHTQNQQSSSKDKGLKKYCIIIYPLELFPQDVVI